MVKVIPVNTMNELLSEATSVETAGLDPNPVLPGGKIIFMRGHGGSGDDADSSQDTAKNPFGAYCKLLRIAATGDETALAAVNNINARMEATNTKLKLQIDNARLKTGLPPIYTK
ncbi:hypothetical protein A3I51_03775 [Candidatus Gottesmanbacteria bacterium RIFCSPLOWO2_02_FULL_38_8]|uniref:Uncharacterized protein n=2 Tax=Candidatus Gottesmaniibacteriota TaxID=1752720 RepID=A0A1F6B2B2_9BACT|nr:MAG: hypothetical protein A3I51_03775 [Candidatus Gottesmanbacteria bacterium RIFCSPLOWO2_02_FULL_38_8]